jgi:vancomycin resistance protein YoaR
VKASLRWAVAATAVVAGLGLAGWATDVAIHDGEVMRNVEVAGRPIGGLGEADLRAHLEALAAEYAAKPLAIAAPTRRFAGTAESWGVSVDVEATLRSAMDVGRGGPLKSLTSWTGAWFAPQVTTPVLVVDLDRIAAEIAGRPESVASPPIDPSFQAVNGTITVSPGRDGQQLDATTVAAALVGAVADGVIPVEVPVEWTASSPRFDDLDLEMALADAASLFDDPIAVRMNGRTTTIPAETARRWIRSTTETGRLTATFDEATASTDLAIRLAELATREIPPEFVVVDGELSVTLGDPVLVCCQSPVASVVEAAARTGAIADLRARKRDSDGGQSLADAFGIREPIAVFTTNHSCCQSRVDNIHRIADIVRGAIIEPGATFSINEFVGKRTIENGFSSAGAIERGHLVQDVGGGVSQFATTLFNAAFFAGLDFADYQSHTIYFSRYPRGREATLGFPAPDLALTNRTPYAMLLWPTYTDTSITVELWSTPYFTVEQTGQASSRWGTSCTRYDTFRRRTAPDGTTLEDSVFATYRPAEGIDCLGNRIPPPRG